MVVASFVFPPDIDCFIALWGKSRERRGSLHGYSRLFFFFFSFWKGTERTFDFHLLRDLASLRKTATMVYDVLG